MGFFSKLKDGLAKTRDTIASTFRTVFTNSEITEAFYDELEEALIMADVGMNTAAVILAQLRQRIKDEKIEACSDAKNTLKAILVDVMSPAEPFIQFEKSVLLIVGVNGVGKTTSIGKLAHVYKSQGRSVLLAAADTFRAAAAEQLTEWAKRADVPIIKQAEGADPAAVVFDAVNSAKAKNIDVLICDTAGRLHNKKNLMEELRKIRRVLDREYNGVKTEVLLVLDATTGQNAINQAKVFAETVNLTGLILTKLDGTAKGGVVIAVNHELNIPLRFIGVGEGMDDLQEFNPTEFVNALLP